MPKELFADNTYSLAKALHNINMAKQYFEDVRYGTKGEIKMLFNQYIQKCDWILMNVMLRLREENKAALKAELNDSIVIDSIMDKLIHLEPENRLLIEQVIDRIIKGENIKIVQ